MIITTSYFANIKKLGDFTPVGIAQWPPRGFHGPSIPWLAPPKDLIRSWKAGGMTTGDYIAWYTSAVLNNLPDAATLVRKLGKFGDKIALCCYEKPEDFCHRHILAARLCEMGIDCQEWQNPVATTQMLLFH